MCEASRLRSTVYCSSSSLSLEEEAAATKKKCKKELISMKLDHSASQPWCIVNFFPVFCIE
jgi:hypothetical protein